MYLLVVMALAVNGEKRQQEISISLVTNQDMRHCFNDNRYNANLAVILYCLWVFVRILI